MADGNVVKRLAGFAVPRWSRRVARRGRAAGGLPLQPARVGSQYWSFIVATAPAMMAAVAIGAYPAMDDCIAQWVTPLLGAAEPPDPALIGQLVT